MRLERAIFINRAPFGRLELDFSDTNLIVLSGINGSGKTTIISYIVDSLFELARTYFSSEFEGRENKYYRVSSGSYSLVPSEVSIVYLRFSVEGRNWDYIDIRNECTREEYDSLITVQNKIPFDEFNPDLQRAYNSKHWNLFGTTNAQELINRYLHTYFPAYRYEIPNYLNEPFKNDLEFNLKRSFSGHLSTPIETNNDLLSIANWIMDVILDKYLYKQADTTTIQTEINLILNCILKEKIKKDVRFGIGPRSQSSQRIAIMSSIQNEVIYPNIFDMSSGELALVNIFIELIRQSDIINKQIKDVSGIVLIDEIDKHLHIRLQKDVLPILISLFPNIQFIITSHSPFFYTGLEQHRSGTYRIVDLDNGGIDCLPSNNHLFREIYDLMISENSRYIDKYNVLKESLKSGTKPLVITEGSTDWKHIKTAIESLTHLAEYKDLILSVDVEFLEFENTDFNMSCSELRAMCKSFAKVFQPRKIIFIADNDDKDTRNELSGTPYKVWGNNVYSLCLPKPDFRVSDAICIEHLYPDEVLKRDVDVLGIKLFFYLGNEFDKYGHLVENSDFFCIDRNSCGPDKIRIIDGEEKNRVINIKGDQSVNYALSKSAFAKMIMNKEAPFESVDFSGFISLIEVIKDIVKEDKQNESDE